MTGRVLVEIPREQPAPLTRPEALALAVETVDKLSGVATNSRGYPVDGTKPATLPERVNAILRLATFLLADDEEDED